MLSPATWAETELPDDSIYHLESNWLNQNGKKTNIIELQGKVQVVAFVYTYCEHSCPFVVANLKHIEGKLSSAQRRKTRFSLFSLDPGRDTPEVLSRYMHDHGLDEHLWAMFNGDSEDVLELSALIGVRYKPMDTEGKEIAHSNMITVLDRQGRIRYQMKGLNEDLDQVVSAIANVVGDAD